MSQTYPYALTFPTAVLGFTMNSVFAPPTLQPLEPTATPMVNSNSYIFIPPTVSLTLEGPGAPTAPLPIEFPVASVFTSGNVIHTSIGFMTYANQGAVSATASAALSQFLHSTDASTGTSSIVPTAILSETAPLSTPSVTPTFVTTAMSSAVSATSTPNSIITSVVTVPGATSTSTLGTNAVATTSPNGLQSSSASVKATATAAPKGSGASKTTLVKKGLAIFCVLAMAVNRFS